MVLGKCVAALGSDSDYLDGSGDEVKKYVMVNYGETILRKDSFALDEHGSAVQAALAGLIDFNNHEKKHD